MRDVNLLSGDSMSSQTYETHQGIKYETNEEQIDLINCNPQNFSYKMHTEILVVGDIEFLLIVIFNSSFYLLVFMFLKNTFYILIQSL